MNIGTDKNLRDHGKAMPFHNCIRMDSQQSRNELEVEIFWTDQMQTWILL